MECFDVTQSLHTLVGASLIVAGARLMASANQVSRGYGAYCFALGYFLVGLVAAGNDLGSFDLQNSRYLLGVGSAVAVVAGTFLMYYHVQEAARTYFQDGRGRLEKGLLWSIPVVDHILVYAGFAGLVLASSMREDGSYNLTKGGLVLGSLGVIGWTNYNLLQAMVDGKDTTKSQVAHILSWGLLVLALGYNC